MSSSSSPSSCAESHHHPNFKICSITRQRGIVEYEGPTVRCLCGEIAPMWTSWTNEHPGMRFYGCRLQVENGGCGFFKWADAAIEGRARVVILGLRDRQRELYSINKKLGTEKEKLIAYINEMKTEIEELRCVNEELKFENEKVSKQNAELQKLNEELKEHNELLKQEESVNNKFERGVRVLRMLFYGIMLIALYLLLW